MSVNYNIKSNVVDIAVDSPTQGDILWIDTNVWYWYAYTNASAGKKVPRPYQMTLYPQYLRLAIKAKAKLYFSGLTFSELAHLIEKKEGELFHIKSAGSTAKHLFKPKEFRHNNPNERRKVLAEIQVAWSQVEQVATLLDAEINNTLLQSSLSMLSTSQLDGYDALIITSMIKAGVTGVITDDGDYSTVPNLTVFTANQNVITKAQTAGKLITR